LHLPHETIVIKESTVNLFAAVDIAEAKLRLQLKKYKDSHSSLALHKRILRRFKHMPALL
jgi:ribosome-associated translation inhibitor RaiA